MHVLLLSKAKCQSAARLVEPVQQLRGAVAHGRGRDAQQAGGHGRVRRLDLLEVGELAGHVEEGAEDDQRPSGREEQAVAA